MVRTEAIFFDEDLSLTERNEGISISSGSLDQTSVLPQTPPGRERSNGSGLGRCV